MSKSRQSASIKDRLTKVGAPLLISIVLVLIFKSHVITPLEITNDFMEPTFKAGDTVYVNRFSRPKNLLVGDIILVRSPYNQDEYVIGRILGKGGDQVQVSSRIAYRNNTPVTTELFPTPNKQTLPILPQGKSDSDHRASMIVPEKSVFIIADNREHGIDSRELGSIAEELIVGKIF